MRMTLLSFELRISRTIKCKFNFIGGLQIYLNFINYLFVSSI